MKTLLISTAIISLVGSAGSVSAQGLGQGLYGSAFLGYGLGDTVAEVSDGTDFLEYTFESEGGILFGATIGATVAPNIRAEAEISFLSQSVDTLSLDSSDSGSGEIDVSDDDVSLTNTYYLANVWYDIEGVAGGSGLNPYVGGGLGLASLDIDTGDSDDGFDEGTGFAYQLGAGVQIPVGAGAVDLGFRYKAVTDVVLIENFLSSGFDLEGESAVSSVQAAYVVMF